MKTRTCLILLALTVALSLTGCQRTTAKTDEQPAVVAEETRQPKPPKPEKPKPSKNEYKISWDEKCSVNDAFLTSAWILEDLGLISTRRTQPTRVRNPRSGRMITKQVTLPDKYGRSDGLSATLKASSTAGIEFHIDILLVPTDACRIAINARSTIQAKDILKQQSNYIKQKISQAIQDPDPEVEPESAAASLSYPKEMVFDRTVSQVYSAIYNWSRRENFKHNGSGSNDKYYKYSTVECASDIQFNFSMRLIDDNKTKLTIGVSNYEGKDEFGLILKTLTESLGELKTNQPASKATTYTETKTLDHPIAAVYETLRVWSEGNGFSKGRNIGGDAFYKYLYCHTAAGIDFNFQMHTTGANETKLNMTVTDQEDRDEFPMILKSLEAALDGIGKTQAVVEEAVELAKPVPRRPAPPKPAAPKTNCQGEE